MAPQKENSRKKKFQYRQQGEKQHRKSVDAPIKPKKSFSTNLLKNYIIRGYKKDWNGLPKNKSLFHTAPHCGLPIGNLTSQVFANFYMHHFDTFTKNKLGLKYFGRYVDDFVIVHPDKDYLKSLIPNFLTFYFQPYSSRFTQKKYICNIIAKA